MRKSLITAALAATFISTAALAASQTETGTIKALDQAKHQLTLATGAQFVLPSSWHANGFKVGDRVKVIYEKQGSRMMASTVEHVG